MWSTGTGSESTRRCGTDASICETSVEPHRETWNTNTRLEPGLGPRRAVERRLCQKEAAACETPARPFAQSTGR